MLGSRWERDMFYPWLWNWWAVVSLFKKEKWCLHIIITPSISTNNEERRESKQYDCTLEHTSWWALQIVSWLCLSLTAMFMLKWSQKKNGLLISYYLTLIIQVILVWCRLYIYILFFAQAKMISQCWDGAYEVIPCLNVTEWPTTDHPGGMHTVGKNRLRRRLLMTVTALSHMNKFSTFGK